MEEIAFAVWEKRNAAEEIAFPAWEKRNAAEEIAFPALKKQHDVQAIAFPVHRSRDPGLPQTVLLRLTQNDSAWPTIVSCVTCI